MKLLYICKQNKHKMKKSRFLIASLIIAVVFTACKNDKAAETETAAKPEANDFFKITMNMVVPKDDHFQIYYNEDGSDLYPADKFVDVEIKGSETAQDIVFKLPNEAVPASLRFDLGSNKDQGAVKIDGLKMQYYDKTFTAPGTNFYFYFGNNEQIDYDREKAVATPKILANQIYDPIFTGTETLKKELKNLVK